MGIAVLVMGESGSGKSSSMRNLDPNKVGIFNVASKPLPFKNKLNKFDKANYNIIGTKLRENKLKTYVIDDSQYLMAFEMFAKAKENGYTKFTDIALNFYNLLDLVARGTTPDTIVYFLHHTSYDESTGMKRAKTIGKMLDTQLTVEGLFSIVLLADSSQNEYKFITQSKGISTAKSPMDMFPMEIDNDLNMVDETIRKYWGLEIEPQKKAEKSKTKTK